METWAGEHSLSAVAAFPAYLQGMETVAGGAGGRAVPHVPSLPTRNGNQGLVLWFRCQVVRSQPTYKEWKPPRCGQGAAMGTAFPAYLQGMETQRWLWTH